MSITYLKYREIDKKKWDECISASPNSLIYAKSFYLDAMAAHWDGLVLNNYEAVMPLTWKRKWGIRYLYQPAFIQQGGVFSVSALSEEKLHGFIKKAFAHFRFAEITLNYLNNLANENDLLYSLRVNYILPLDKNYEELFLSYASSVVKNIKRAKNNALIYQPGQDYQRLLDLYKERYSKQLPYFSDADYINFEKVCHHLFLTGNLVTRYILTAGGQLIAGAVLLKDQNRLYNVVSYVSPAGRLARANYFLYDQLIREFAQQDLVLDFEGSDVKGIAEFYQRFSPNIEQYPFVKMNRLPALLKMVKR